MPSNKELTEYPEKNKVINMKATGEKIRLLMKEKEISMGTLISALNLMSTQSVYKWFRGETIPSIDHMIILKDLFGLEKIDDLLVVETEKSDTHWIGRK